MDSYHHTITDCRLLSFQKIESEAGSLSVLNGEEHLPFVPQRVYYIYDLPAGAQRGGHAHKSLDQVLIPINGSFEVKIYDGQKHNTILLNNPNTGLHIKAGIWRELSNFSEGAICLTLASKKYDESDYIREQKLFEAYKQA